MTKEDEQIPLNEMPYGLKVRELRRMLIELPAEFDNYVMVVAGDPEGNRFDTLSEIAVGWYSNWDERHFTGYTPVDDGTWPEAMQQATNDFLHGDEEDEDDDEEDSGEEPTIRLEHDFQAICLWP